MFLGFGKRIKSMFTDYICMFWTFVFPLCLSILFSVTIPTISAQQYDSTPIAIINSEGSDHQLIQIISSMKTTNDKELFHVTLCTKIMAEEKLENGDIVAYIDSGNNYEIYAKTNEMQVLLVKSFLQWYQQEDGRVLMDFNMQYIMQECGKENFDKNVLYFLSLICMAAIFSMHWGVRIVADLEGNLSGVGMRTVIAPVKKSKILIQNFIAVILIQIYECSVVLLLLGILGKIQCKNNWYMFLLIQTLISVIGILLGMIIGSNKKLNYQFKHNITQYLGIFFGFFAGLMFYKIRFSANEQFPYFMKINPVNVGVDAMFQLCFVESTSVLYHDLCLLGIVILILTVVVIYITRRKIYARI